MSHEHTLKKTHLTITEYDDIDHNKLAIDTKYFGEGNSKGRMLEYDFEYCLSCNHRTLNGEPVITQGILEQELEHYVVRAKSGNYVSSEQTKMQHSDFEALERIIKSAIALGKLRAGRRTRK